MTPNVLAVFMLCVWHCSACSAAVIVVSGMEDAL